MGERNLGGFLSWAKSMKKRGGHALEESYNPALGRTSAKVINALR